ncbi:tandem-95 repeat protein [Calothrix sp. FACHB-156]|nr:tandem-95 repeat protein [Calothrix sp. FACHB-156]
MTTAQIQAVAGSSAIDFGENGSFDSANNSLFRTGNDGFNAYRFAIEFNLSSLLSSLPSAATINSFQLRLRTANFVQAGQTTLAGYAGNGSFELADVTTGSDLLTFTPITSSPFTLDVTNFVKNLIAGNNFFAGFNVRQNPEIPDRFGPWDGLNNFNFPLLIVDYTAPNSNPVAQPDTASTNQDTPVTINVLANDTDPDSNPLSISGFTTPAHGTVAINDNGTPTNTSDDKLVYTPSTGYSGTDSFSYTISDGQGGTSTATVGLTINAVNKAPTAVNLLTPTTTLAETNTPTPAAIKLADITITDDGLGSNTLSLSGTDAATFEIQNNALYLKAGTILDFETKAAYNVTVNVDDPTVGSTPDASTNYTLNLSNVNEAPTNLTLSQTSIAENVAEGTPIGTFSTTDAEGGSFTYALIAGTGDTDNNAFTIIDNQLTINSSPNFENQSSYNILVKTTDAGGLSYEKALTINVTDVNEAPTNLTLSQTSIAENVAEGTQIGTFSTTDAEGGSFTYALIAGMGDTDNNAFTITGNQLTINSSPNFENQSSYNILVKTTDAGGLSYEKALTINVTDVNEAPTNLTLSQTSIAENVAEGTPIGTFSTTDAEGGSFTYALIAGTGDTDNNAFTITSNQLTINSSPNFETQPTYNILVKTTDAGGLSYEKALTINVTDINEAPSVTGETVSTSQNTSVTVELGDNLSDPDANGLANAILNITGTNNGTVSSIDQDARLVTFTPTAGFSGTASFNYTLTDAGSLVSNTATVTVEVGSVISTGNRNQDIEGNNGDDIISAGNGSDRLKGLGGNDQLSGNNGNDTLDGGDGKDTLLGGNGSDVLVGGNGDDFLNGGNGADTVTGGAGSDRFVLITSAGGDTFTDFTDTVDRIALSGGLTFGQLTIAAIGGDTAIRQGSTTLATLTGVSANLITAADFVTL